MGVERYLEMSIVWRVGTKSLESEVCVRVCQETSGPVLCDCCAISLHQKGYCISVLEKGKTKISEVAAIVL